MHSTELLCLWWPRFECDLDYVPIPIIKKMHKIFCFVSHSWVCLSTVRPRLTNTLLHNTAPSARLVTFVRMVRLSTTKELLRLGYLCSWMHVFLSLPEQQWLSDWFDSWSLILKKIFYVQQQGLLFKIQPFRLSSKYHCYKNKNKKKNLKYNICFNVLCF